MGVQTQANSILYQFLDSCRRRLEFGNAMSSVGIAATVIAIAAAPFVAWRSGLGLNDSILFILIILGIAVVFAALYTRRGVRIQQVPDRLDASADDRDRLASATEFMGDPDPFKRLAVRQTEEWIAEENDRLSRSKTSKWPFYGAAAILLLLLLWLLTPGIQNSLSSQKKAVSPPPMKPPSSAAGGSQPGSQANQPQSSAAASNENSTPPTQNSGSGQTPSNPSLSNGNGQKRSPTTSPSKPPSMISIRPNGSSGEGAGKGNNPGQQSGGSNSSSSGSQSNSSGSSGNSSSQQGSSPGNQSSGGGSTSGSDGNGSASNGPDGNGSQPGQSPGNGSENQSGQGNQPGSGHSPQPGSGANSGQTGNGPPGGSLPSRGSGPLAPTGSAPAAPLFRVYAARSRPGDSSQAHQTVGEVFVHTATQHPSAEPDVQFEPIEIDGSELEALPPRRRQVVIEYFRLMQGRSTEAPATDPATGD